MRFALFISISLISISIRAQEASGNRTFAALIVNNRDKSIEWYKEYLNMELLDSTSIPDRELKMANLISSEFHIELIELGESEKPTDDGRSTQGIFKVGRVIAKFDQMHDKLKAKEATFRSEIFYDEKNKLRSFIILDFSGNRIQFFGK